MGQLQSFDSRPPDDHFPAIIDTLRDRGWVVLPGFLDAGRYLPLFNRALALDAEFRRAAIGRGDDQQTNRFVRSDRIRWLDPANGVDRSWLALMEGLRLAINRELFLGLFEYESHYACYDPGSFYKRHLDAFRGEGNRVLSVVLYLNPDWQPGDGGELVIYPGEPAEGLRFLPSAGSLAVFLSEELPHEVLPAGRTRYSIAGWFRLNATHGARLDPPA